MTDEIFAGAFAPDQEPVADAAPIPAPEPAPDLAPEAVQEPEPQPEPEAQAAPEPKADIPPGHVPLAALLDVRDKLKDAEARLRDRPQVQSVEAPDPYADPDGFAYHTQSVLQQQLLNQTLNVSERFARKEHGAETVDRARTWAMERFQQDPLYYQQVVSDPDPYERVVADFKREQVFSAMQPTDLDAFLAWKAAQAATQTPMAAVAATPQPSPAAPPPRSLASATSAGGATAPPPGTAYDALFQG